MNEKMRAAAAAAALILVLAAGYAAYRVIGAGAGAPLQAASSSQAAAQSAADEKEPKESGGSLSPALDFTMSDSLGGEVTLSSLYGKPTVVNFWATWCGYCTQELPHFQRVYDELGEKVNFVMLDAVEGNETRERAAAFFADNGYTMPLYFDDAKTPARALYGITGLPSTLFIDSLGNIAAFAPGMINEETLRAGIERAMAEGSAMNVEKNPSWCEMEPVYTRITPENAKSMMEEFSASPDGGGYILLDVRTQAEFDEKHIPGAVLIPDNELLARAEKELPDKRQVILVYCRSGRRSAEAAKALVGLGYNHVYDFGGIIDWPYETAG